MIISQFVSTLHKLISWPFNNTFYSLKVHQDFLITLWNYISPLKYLSSYPPRKNFELLLLPSLDIYNANILCGKIFNSINLSKKGFV